MHKSEGASTRLSLFVPISKFDEETGIAYGYAAEEARDRANEIMDYAKAKPKFQSWSDTQKAASGGKSLGNIRLMHTSQPVGKLDHLEFMDDEKRVFVGAKVTDEQTRKDVAAGVLTGFSIGGSYAEKWKDGDLMRYVPEIQEISLVDRPCMPGATFTFVKSDGGEELRKQTGRELKQVWACGTKGHEHVAKSDAVACADEDAMSEAAAEDKKPTEDIVPIAIPTITLVDKKAAGALLRKSMYSVGDLAAVVCSLDNIRISAQFEAEYEGDGSKIPDALKVEVEHLSEVLLQMTEEETAELTAEKSATVRMRKFIARIPEADRAAGKEFLIKAADAFEHAGEEEIEMKTEELQKVIGDSMTKAIGEFTSTLEKKLDEKLAKVEERLGAVEKATPAPAKAVARVVEKAADHTDTKGAPAPKPVGVDAMIKDAFSRPISMDPRVAGGFRKQA